jgi:hypothetical protein
LFYFTNTLRKLTTKVEDSDNNFGEQDNIFYERRRTGARSATGSPLPAWR